jgi:hypothetical protein
VRGEILTTSPELDTVAHNESPSSTGSVYTEAFVGTVATTRLVRTSMCTSCACWLFTTQASRVLATTASSPLHAPGSQPGTGMEMLATTARVTGSTRTTRPARCCVIQIAFRVTVTPCGVS